MYILQYALQLIWDKERYPKWNVTDWHIHPCLKPVLLFVMQIFGVKKSLLWCLTPACDQTRPWRRLDRWDQRPRHEDQRQPRGRGGTLRARSWRRQERSLSVLSQVKRGTQTALDTSIIHIEGRAPWAAYGTQHFNILFYVLIPKKIPRTKLMHWFYRRFTYI